MSGPAANTRKPDYAERVIRSLPRRLARLMAMHCLAGWRYRYVPADKVMWAHWGATTGPRGSVRITATELNALIQSVEKRIAELEILRMRRSA